MEVTILTVELILTMKLDDSLIDFIRETASVIRFGPQKRPSQLIDRAEHVGHEQEDQKQLLESAEFAYFG